MVGDVSCHVGGSTELESLELEDIRMSHRCKKGESEQDLPSFVQRRCYPVSDAEFVGIGLPFVAESGGLGLCVVGPLLRRQ